MKLNYKQSEKEYNHSVSVSRETEPCFDSDTHFHEEYELLYTIQGSGIRFVGDRISDFGPGQLLLVGPWMPHLWKHNGADGHNKDVNSISIRFTRTFNGQDFFSIPEFFQIVELLEISQKGILFNCDTIHKVAPLLRSMPNLEGAARVISLLEILRNLAEAKDYRTLASSEYTLPKTLYGENRLNRLINYIHENYHRSIDLDAMATEAAMTRSSVCRYFKSRTNKTIFQFINEYRVRKACQFLISGEQSISEICFSTGFNSLTSFNRVFKTYKKVTPSEFKKNYLKLHFAELPK